ncbi:cytochrome c biogenesis protein ResB [Gudongella sp. DL1XJH-153]|uniref:cytochrome c biogenesis protein ResB n=1 Tax=Gudongella sp. DL1XJH-153 TaxID=3409804 RepID=UPI003BB7FCDF
MTIDKFIRRLTSLGLAIALFVLIAAYSIIGTVLPQGLQREFYIENYPSIGSAITTLQFDQVYSSWIFRILLFLFIVNLSGCTLKILPGQLKKIKGGYFPEPKSDAENLHMDNVDLEKFRGILKKKRYSIIQDENGFKATRHRIGNLGSSVTHLGIIIIILGSFIGNIYAQEGFFNMLPGDIKSFPEYGFSLKLDDFRLEYRENGSVDQYYSDLTILKPGVDNTSDTIWVNNPLKVDKVNFYQTSYGWASNLEISDITGENMQAGLLRNGESFFYQPGHLTVYLYGYFPNMTITSQGEPITMTEQELNPHYAVILYEFGNHVASEVLGPGQEFQYKEYKLAFMESELYTGITYRKDFGYNFVMIGSLLMTLGLILSFYYYPKHILVEEGSIKTITRQNTWGFNFQVRQMIEKSAEKEE